MNKRKIIRVRDVMKHEFDIVNGMSTVSEALQQMKHVDTKTLIVDKRDENDEYGILLIPDIARKVLAEDRCTSRVNVYEIMSKPVLSVAPDMDIRYAARLFQRFRISRAPVVEDKKIIGIVSLTCMVLNGLPEFMDEK